MSRRRTAAQIEEASEILKCREAGLRGEAWSHRTFVQAQLALGVEPIISPLLNHPDAGPDVFSRGGRAMDETWLEEWTDDI